MNFHWPDLNVDDVKGALLNLRSFLREKSFHIYYSQLVLDGYFVVPFTPDPFSKVPPQFKVLGKLFLWGSNVPISDFDKLFGLLGKRLIEIDFLNIDEKGQVFSKFRLMMFNKLIIAIPYQKYLGQRIYIGGDSFSLARNASIPLDRKFNVVDLFSGTGFQSLLLKGLFSRVVAVDVLEHAVSCTQLNRLLNGVSCEEYKVVRGDLLSIDIKDITEPVDLLLANPPIIPTPSLLSKKYKMHFDGGEDGLKYVRHILPQITSDVLTRGGIANVLACSLGNSQKPFFADEISSLIDSDQSYEIVVLKQIPIELDAYYRATGSEEKYNLWIDFYKRQEASYWYRLLIIISDKKKLSGSLLKLNRSSFEEEGFINRPIHIPSPKHTSKFQYEQILRYLVTQVERKESTVNLGKELHEKFPGSFPTISHAIRWIGLIHQRLPLNPQLERFLW